MPPVSPPVCRLALSLFAAAGAALLVAGCSEDPSGTDDDCPDGQQFHPIDQTCVPADDVGGADAGGDDGDADDQQPSEDNDCEGLECDQTSCEGPASTSISGTVTIPSGELPLPDVNVYVPYEGTVEPVPEGASCERCEDQLSGVPLTHDSTNRRGEFQIPDVPAADEVPVIVEVGKWRRQLTVTDVQPCEDNPVDAGRTRLPRNTDEGHIPRIALTTGSLDAIECLLRKIGIDDQEFTTDRDVDPDGAVHLFAGEGPPSGPLYPEYPDATDRFDDSLNDGAEFTEATDWYDDLDNLLNYDIVIHSCEGEDNLEHKPQQARQALQDFTHAGGRVFLSHWHNIWLDEGPSGFDSVATWEEALIDGTETGYIDTSFPKGQMLREWMDENSAPDGHFEINEARGTIASINEQLAQQWVYLEEDSFLGDPDQRTQYFSFNTPVDVEPHHQCGRVVFSDIHVAAGDDTGDHNPFPTGCTTQGLSDQEKALVFMFFDLARCIIDDGKKEPSD